MERGKEGMRDWVGVMADTVIGDLDYLLEVATHDERAEIWDRMMSRYCRWCGGDRPCRCQRDE